jgi:hypothetical protein
MLNALYQKYIKKLGMLSYNEASNLLIVLFSLIGEKNVSLYKMRSQVGVILGKEQIKASSHYQRLIRFFTYAGGCHKEVLSVIFRLQFQLLKDRTRLLVMDGTSWKIGSRKYHLLVLGMVWKGVCIPIGWVDLCKLGTSCFKERKLLFEEVFSRLDIKKMILLADREYIGKEWLEWLAEKGLGFIVRLKLGVYKKAVNQSGGDRYSKMLKQAKRGKTVCKRIRLNHKWFYLVIGPNPKQGAEEPIVAFISTLKNKRKVMQTYGERWKIETCFQKLKGHGFQLENIGLKCPKKVEVMVGLVALAYTICVLEGLASQKADIENGKQVLKKYNNGKEYLSVSTFREGLDITVIKVREFWVACQFFWSLLEQNHKPYYRYV